MRKDEVGFQNTQGEVTTPASNPNRVGPTTRAAQSEFRNGQAQIGQRRKTDGDCRPARLRARKGREIMDRGCEKDVDR